jgi:glycosyltransferase involved in cell wall biosynthesis
MTLLTGQHGRAATGSSVHPSTPTATICQLLHTLQTGGAEVLAARLARQLRHRYRFLFLCLDACGELGEALRQEGLAVHVLDRRAGLDWRCSLRMARFFRRERVDVIHAHQCTPFFYGATARLLYPKARVLLTEHGRHYPDFPRRKRMIANRLLLGRGDRVVGVGEAVRKALIDNEGIPAGRVEVIYNGVDLSAHVRGVSDASLTRRELGLGEADFVVIQVARLDYLKDHATALRTLARLLPLLPQARLVLVGEGPEEPGIRKVVKELGVQEQVRFLGLRQDVARLLAAADAFLLSSISEGIPLTVIEAMGAGLPVVATRVGGLPEVVQEELTGLLAPRGDDAALAAHLVRLAAEPALRRRLGEQGRDRARDLFSESRMHRAYVRVYEDLLGG